ncbi:MAG: hypothetical protein ACXVXP_02965 [Mycobacteriaceae bacterium]
MNAFGQTVTLQSRTVSGKDAYGNTTYSETETLLQNVPIWPAGSSELLQGQDILTDTLVALFPHGTVVSPTDRVLAYGRTYEVTGSPFDWVSPFTSTRAGVQVNLKVVTG